MYPLSREWQRAIPEHNLYSDCKKVVTADFHIPVSRNAESEVLRVFARNVQWRSQQRSSSRELSTTSNNLELNDNNDRNTPCMRLQIGVGKDKWKLYANCTWLRSLNTQSTSSQFSLVKGTIHFRSKYFGSWEPFEYIKHFLVEKCVFENNSERSVMPIFTAEQLEQTFAMLKPNLTRKFTLEMTLTVERVSFSDEMERLLCAQAIRMNNALNPTPQKSDFRIKVGDEEFFVHLHRINAFSCVSETLSKYVKNSDWSALLSPDSMQALLRFIYYCEVDMICNPKITFDLMRFGHMYQVLALFKICREKLMTFSVDMYTVSDLFDIYMFVRIPDEFQQLKRHFCRMLFENAVKYDATELKQLAKRKEDGSGVDALVEILQFVDEEEPDNVETPSSRKRPRTEAL